MLDGLTMHWQARKEYGGKTQECFNLMHCVFSLKHSAGVKHALLWLSIENTPVDSIKYYAKRLIYLIKTGRLVFEVVFTRRR